ncbi:MAG: hypothetical protein BJ554DRAFT_4359 [Olpidium bornovanus]|uniref:Uncharacterized protein n=1 Tax=Olpidium bornovanus TaxID=278681 RepID=A0A8H7ZMB5_9FUNG|nr:MAG: hypothetical protein BJ554DRAFT_4359 [Olpidium bornovanus]
MVLRRGRGESGGKVGPEALATGGRPEGGGGGRSR